MVSAGFRRWLVLAFCLIAADRRSKNIWEQREREREIEIEGNVFSMDRDGREWFMYK